MKCHKYFERGCEISLPESEEQNPIINSKSPKLNVYDWLQTIPGNLKITDIVEIRFKNTRKGFYLNVNKLVLVPGDVVALEAQTGHDIGIVTLAGELVLHQLKYHKFNENDIKKIYRKAKPADVVKWVEAMNREHSTMIRTRQIVEKLNLNMKVGDVEYQGDNTKAIFYYIADERVDFRELIKILAEEFRIKVEMKQIGARQEAGRIGGLGTCGRELCCSTWISNFVSVSTNAARDQELSLNPQKLAGQCSKLKCCLNFEHDTYLDKLKDLPNTQVALETMDGTAYFHKTDVFRDIMWYSFDKENMVNMTPVPIERVRYIMEQNKKGVKVDKLITETSNSGKPDHKKEEVQFENVIGQDSLTRFDKDKSKKKKKKKPGHQGNPNQPQGNNNQNQNPQKLSVVPANPVQQNPQVSNKPAPDNNKNQNQPKQNQNPNQNNNNQQKPNNNQPPRQNNNNIKPNPNRPRPFDKPLNPNNNNQ